MALNTCKLMILHHKLSAIPLLLTLPDPYYHVSLLSVEL